MKLTSIFIFVVQNRSRLMFISLNLVEKRRFEQGFNNLKIKTMNPEYARVLGVLHFLNFQTFQYHVYTCDNPLTLSAFGSVGCLLALKALCHASHLMFRGSIPHKTILFTSFSFFHVFSSNFHNFFDQSKLLILRWFFGHLSINTSILWLCKNFQKKLSSDYILIEPKTTFWTLFQTSF